MSKEIKQLKAFFRDLAEVEKAFYRTIRKLKAMQKWLEINIPFNIRGTYSFSPDLGETCPRCFINLNKDEDSTITLMKWIPELKKGRFTVEKFWRKENGYFSYQVSKKIGTYKTGMPVDYIFFFEEGANIDGCVITKKRKMQEVFVTDCETESREL